ncbi:DSBA oxidoreductase [Nanobdella aerobiophila]|uniref:DSBA oxidoreductase n=1 Tax=Nanobdella aerobiophila TaxID=2586965 RepID=A0A915WR65_9ARCH|nr:DsbA family protein [Nanobdella aerobiophila]BBL45198.1 DSBA oxidoreductase [Nanobdella aerobiophila]
MDEKEKKSLGIRDAIIIGSIIVAVSIIIGAYIVSSSLSNISLASGQGTTSQLQTYISTLQTEPLPNITNIDPVYGNPNSTNVIVYEYSDYACPFCDEFYLETFPSIYQNYIQTGQISWVYKVFPLYSIHPYANITSQYLTTIYELYGFNTWEEFTNWSWYNQLQGVTWDGFSNQTAVYEAFNSEAQNLGLNVSLIDAYINNMTYYPVIYNSETNAIDTYGIDATPSFIIAVKTSNINYSEISSVENELNSLKQYGLSYSVYKTPDGNYIMFQFAGALPYSFFSNILGPLTQG